MKNLKQAVQTMLPPVLRKSFGRSRAGASKARSFHVCLESPTSHMPIADEVLIKGWAFSRNEQEVHGEVCVNGLRQYPLQGTRPRVDVAAMYGLQPSEADVGFEFRLPWEEIADEETFADLEIEFYHESGSQSFGPIRVYRAQAVAEPRFLFRLERPGNDEVLAGDIEVRGWAFSLDGQDISGTIVVNEEFEIPICFAQARIDVANVYDLERGPVLPGFAHLIPWDSLGEKCHEASIRIELYHGRDLIGLGPYFVRNVSAPTLRHQRGSYKEVWTGVACDETDAFTSVAATSDTEDLLESGRSTANTLREALNISASDSVLEIGCGIGRIGKFLSRDCALWVGADISSEMLQHAKSYLEGIENAELVELSSCSLAEFSDESFDKVYCSTVFMHLDEWDRFRYIQEAFRVLRPGGMLYVDNLNLAGEMGWAVFEDAVGTDAAQRSAAVSKPSTAEELMTYFDRAGFRAVEKKPGPHYVAVFGKKR